MTPVTSLPAGCTIGTAGRFTCNLGDLLAGQKVELRFKVVSSVIRPIINTATVASDTFDPDTANNTHRTVVSTQPFASTPFEAAELEVTKAAIPDRLVVREDKRDKLVVPPEVTYIITVGNNGPETASNVQMVDILVGTLVVPMNVLSLTSTQGTCEIRNPRSPDAALVPPISSVDELHILCNLGDIADGASIEVTLIIATGGPIDGIVSNAVSAASSTPDPDLANNEAGVLVPPPQILGDVNGDGLVDALDRKIVKDCAKQKGQDTPECDTTDVNGDGVVDGRDVAIVAARKFAKRLEPGEEATAEISNNSQLGTVEGALNKIGTFVLDAFGSTKPAIIAEFGVLPNVQKIPSSTLTTGVGAGKNAVFTDIPDGTVVGASGCDPCIGIILLPPEDDPQVFHFAATDDAKDTMKEAGPFPDGTRAAIFGGNNTLESNVTLNLVAEFFRENPQITVEGYSDTVGLWVDREGTFVRRNDKLDALSINVR